jgi:hypothetical protein
MIHSTYSVPLALGATFILREHVQDIAFGSQLIHNTFHQSDPKAKY